MPEADFLIKQGDTASIVTATLQNSSGTAVDIQNATIRWKMMPLAGGTVTVLGTASNLQNTDGSDGSRGNVSYSWGTTAPTAPPSTPGRYLGEWEVTYASGAIQTYPNDDYIRVDVLADVR